jgi:hypothetical protein
MKIDNLRQLSFVEVNRGIACMGMTNAFSLDEVDPVSKRTRVIDRRQDRPRIVDDPEMFVVCGRAVRLPEHSEPSTAFSHGWQRFSAFLMVVTIGSVFATGFAFARLWVALKAGNGASILSSGTALTTFLLLGTVTFTVRRRLWRWIYASVL